MSNCRISIDARRGKRRKPDGSSTFKAKRRFMI